MGDEGCREVREGDDNKQMCRNGRNTAIGLKPLKQVNPPIFCNLGHMEAVGRTRVEDCDTLTL